MPVSTILVRAFYWRGLSFFVSVLVNILLAHIFGAAFSAQFYYLIYLFSLFASFFTLGLDIGISHFLSRKQISIHWISRVIMTVLILSMVLGLPSIYLLERNDTAAYVGTKDILLFAALYIPGSILISLSTVVLTSFQKNHSASMISFFFSVVLLILLFGAFFFLPPSEAVQYATWLWFVFVFAQGLFTAAYSRRVAGAEPSAGYSKTVSLKKIVAFSFFAFLINYLFLLAGRIPVFFLQYHVSSYILGNYIYAYKVLEYGATVAAFLYFPVLALVAGEHEKMESAVLFLTRLSNTMVLMVGGVLAFTGQYLFPLLLGPSFDLVHRMFLFLFPGLLAMCSSTFFTAYFFGKDLLKYNFRSACIMLLIMLTLIFPLTRLWGAEGASLAFSVANLASFGYDLFIFRRFSRYSFREIFLLGRNDWQQVARWGKQARTRPDID